MTAPSDATWGKTPHRLLALSEAWDILAADIEPMQRETVPLAQAAERVLAAPVINADDAPPFDKSMMDGFAVRSGDCREPGAALEVLGLAAAGDTAVQAVGPGQAVRINTGAPVPSGADAVVPIENVRLTDGGRRVTIGAAVCAGRHIVPRGADRKRHDLILAPPIRLEAHRIAAAASAGAATVEVFPEVHAAIAVTGNELVPVGRPRQPAQIYESNGPMLAALLRRFGATPHTSGILRDDPAELKAGLADALRHPVVVAVGGMSMGTHDLVPQVFTDLGVTWRFHGVRVRPGKPAAYGRGPDGQHVFGLPGNPVSALVCAWLFVRMVVRGLHGHPPLPPPRWRAALTRDLPPGKDARPAFLPARVWCTASRGMQVEPCAWGGSGDLFGLAPANALLVRDDPTAPAPAGSPADVILIAAEP